MRKEEIDARLKGPVKPGQEDAFTGWQTEKPAEAESKMMWIRTCPHCQNKLCKYTLQHSTRCERCGWVWQ